MSRRCGHRGRPAGRRASTRSTTLPAAWTCAGSASAPWRCWRASGAFDALNSNRRKVFESLEALMAFSAALHEERASAQVSLFGDAANGLPAPRLRSRGLVADGTAGAGAAGVGFYLSGHPLDDYAAALRRERRGELAELLRMAGGGSPWSPGSPGPSPGDQRKSARGSRFAFVRLSDPTGIYEVRCLFALEAAARELEPGHNVMLTVEATLEGDDCAARQGGPADRRRPCRRRRHRPAGLRRGRRRGAVPCGPPDRGVRDAVSRRRGPVRLILMAPASRRGRHRPAGALSDHPAGPRRLKTLPGVVHVEEF